ncbi:hypothetical protein JTE90_008322, partial [Oedothorax gibbosus]
MFVRGWHKLLKLANTKY